MYRVVGALMNTCANLTMWQLSLCLLWTSNYDLAVSWKLIVSWKVPMIRLIKNFRVILREHALIADDVKDVEPSIFRL